MAFLVRIEQELAEVHDATDRWFRRRHDLDQIEPSRLGLPARILDGNNTEILSFSPDQADLGNIDLAVYAILLVSGYASALHGSFCATCRIGAESPGEVAERHRTEVFSAACTYGHGTVFHLALADDEQVGDSL